MKYIKNSRISDVYFSGSFSFHHINEKKGKRVSVKKDFYWENEHWFVPAFYICPKGIVVDICAETKTQEFNKFIEKWDLLNVEKENHRTDRERNLTEQENPLEHRFTLKIKKNSKVFTYNQMQSLCYIPFQEENKKAASIVKRYKLDTENCWSIYRFSFPCGIKGNIKELSVILNAESVNFPAQSFSANKGDVIKIKHPLNSDIFHLTVKDIIHETLDTNAINNENKIFPNNYQKLIYTVTPDISEGNYKIRDMSPSDRPIIKKENPNCFLPDSSASIAVIGGADGPTAVIFGNRADEEMQHCAFSSLYFNKNENIIWQFSFIETLRKDITIPIYGGKKNG